MSPDSDRQILGPLKDEKSELMCAAYYWRGARGVERQAHAARLAEAGRDAIACGICDAFQDLARAAQDVETRAPELTVQLIDAAWPSAAAYVRERMGRGAKVSRAPIAADDPRVRQWRDDRADLQ